MKNSTLLKQNTDLLTHILFRRNLFVLIKPDKLYKTQ